CGTSGHAETLQWNDLGSAGVRLIQCTRAADANAILNRSWWALNALSGFVLPMRRRDRLSAHRDNSLRRLSTLTWRAGLLSAVGVFGLMNLFNHMAGTTAVTQAKAATPTGPGFTTPAGSSSLSPTASPSGSASPSAGRHQGNSSQPAGSTTPPAGAATHPATPTAQPRPTPTSSTPRPTPTRTIKSTPPPSPTPTPSQTTTSGTKPAG